MVEVLEVLELVVLDDDVVVDDELVVLVVDVVVDEDEVVEVDDDVVDDEVVVEEEEVEELVVVNEKLDLSNTLLRNSAMLLVFCDYTLNSARRAAALHRSYINPDIC